MKSFNCRRGGLVLMLSLFSGFSGSVEAGQESRQAGPPAAQKAEADKQAAAPRTLPTSRREAAIMDWEQARAWTKAYLDAMPAEHYGFKPVPEIRTFAEQLLHGSQSTFSLGALATGRDNPYAGKEFHEEKPLQQKIAATERVVEAYTFVIDGLKGTTDEKLNEIIPARRGTVMVPRWQVLQWAFTNQTHHRGQTTIYLRLKGMVPPPQPAM
ncbi:MAG: DinB family protein [Acidobacteria bacterium]|nr:DinB family protein [Acidobacteriota bacterium]